jgi:tripartite-type tricarboxylate transporter receptor subunit TctC
MNQNIIRTLVIIGIIGSWIFLLQGLDLAEAKDPEYPTKPITFIIPSGAGGNNDYVGRSITEATSKYLGQPFIPINKPAGGFTVGMMTVINAKPDGYTLGVTVAAAIFSLPHTEECPYKDISGFTFINRLAQHIYPLIVRSDAPWKTWQEFIEWARKNPRAAKLSLTGPKSGTSIGITLWQAEKKEKVEFAYLQYKAGDEVLTALLGGHLTMGTMGPTVSSMEYLKGGKLRILAYLSKTKIAGYENIPNFLELYGVEAPSFLGVVGPKGLPDYVVEKLDDAFAKGARDPHFINAMNRIYTPVGYMNRAEVNDYVNKEFTRVGELMKIIRAEEAKGKK